MDAFEYRNGQLFAEDVNLDDLAQRVGTPAYVYSRRTFEDHYDRIAQAFAPLDPIICYSIKSCGNIHICKLLGNRGAGMDVVSGGELHRAALRVNPDVADPNTHAKTATGKKETKFGVDIDRARRFFEKYGNDPHLKLTGIHLHIGSPIYSAEPYVLAIQKALELIDDLRILGFTVNALDIGGGFAADYESGASPLAADYADRIVPLLQPFTDAGGKVILEPGRTIAANAGILLTRVQYVKTGGAKKFIIVDTGMHHLIRPALYDSFHFIWPTRVAPMHQPQRRGRDVNVPGAEPCDIVGPICETGDSLAKDRPLPPVARGDLLAVFTAGAYGMVMASHYNAMPMPPEILVDGAAATVIRRRETYDDLVAAELEAQRV